LAPQHEHYNEAAVYKQKKQTCNFIRTAHMSAHTSVVHDTAHFQ